ncbi:MAG: V-type ATPase 116kDa subunit family protein [Bacteroidales bacterium]|nr:V-type ATPase 116kDa subunit family protein [Bacteroidales bacterium]
MITKMTKYSFVLLTGEKEGFLEQLQELGVVDISRSVKPIDSDSSVMFHKAERARKTLEFLEGIDYSKDADAEAIAKATVNIEGDPVDFIEECRAKLTELHTALANAEKQLQATLPWGEYDKKALDDLKDLGYAIRYYAVDAKKFDESWGELYPLQVVENNGKKVWFVTVAPKGEAYSFPVQEVAAPEITSAEAASDIARIKTEITDCKAGLLNAKDYIPAIKEACNSDLVELDRYLAKEAGEGAAEDMITVFTGFAPVENDAELVEAFDKMGVLYIKEDAAQEDNPPIKLRNNWFTRQFECFTEMYGMPVYSEFDPTPILAPFYLLFFAMCLGDAGYGIVLLLFGLMLNKGWLKVGMFDGLGNIIALLGAGTIVVGTVLGTFFGIGMYDASWVPEWMKSLMIVGDVDVPGVGVLNIQMLLAMGIGIFHICVAMTVKAICYTKRFGWKENIATWGWLILIVGGVLTGLLALGKLISPEAIKWALIIIGAVSALAIYIFNTPGRNPLVNVGAGLWDTYNMATGILGDVLSYLRLFALGLAGGMLGQAFNNLALSVKGDAVMTWVPFVLILIVGHVINILLSSLGAFVHPMRLTFMEYFKNAGYEGKGSSYNPLTTNKE